MNREIQIGRFRIVALEDGCFALDGGAMFGVVPRPLWEKLTPVNDDHTVPLSTTPFLVDDGKNKIVIEPGIGQRWSEKERVRYHIDHSEGRTLVESLRGVGVQPEEVTHCLMTHCHWDHIGAVCGNDGLPVFREAEHWAPQIEIDCALNPDHLRRASYRADDIAPLLAEDLLQGFQGEFSPLEGIRMIPVGGHSDGVCLVLIEDGGGTACFWTDIVPTANHVALPFIMAYDMNAARSWEVRSQWIPRAAEEEWACLLYHDPVSPIGKFVSSERSFSFLPLDLSDCG